MRVVRYRYKTGYVGGDEYEKFEYSGKVDLSQLDHNMSFPGLRFTLRIGEWPDNAPKRPDDYLRIDMLGAEAYWDVGNLILTGFVQEPEEDYNLRNRNQFLIERWYINKEDSSSG